MKLVSFTFISLLFYSLDASAQSPTEFGVTNITPPVLTMNPSPRYWPRLRMWQGIPSIERAANGRLWATWYCGPIIEGENGEGNYAVLVTSNDDGKTWSKPVAAYDANQFFGGITLDPHLWRDPAGRMWWFVNRNLKGIKDENGTLTVWGFSTNDPNTDSPKWNAPVFTGYGSALNKPTVLSNGDWIRPVDTFKKDDPERTRFYVSHDQGKSFTFLSKTPIKDGSFSEHMIIERKDKTLFALSRAKYGIAQIDSRDNGKTWQNDHALTTERGVNARFHLRRMKSGNLLLVLNDHPKDRTNMTAMLSEDEGKTWPHKILLDDRALVSYPDATESPDGFLYIIYDCGRYTKDRQEILFAKINEADIKAGKLVSKESRLKQLINRLSDTGGGVRITNESKKMKQEYDDKTAKPK